MGCGGSKPSAEEVGSPTQAAPPAKTQEQIKKEQDEAAALLQGAASKHLQNKTEQEQAASVLQAAAAQHLATIDADTMAVYKKLATQVTEEWLTKGVEASQPAGFFQEVGKRFSKMFGMDA